MIFAKILDLPGDRLELLPSVYFSSKPGLILRKPKNNYFFARSNY